MKINPILTKMNKKEERETLRNWKNLTNNIFYNAINEKERERERERKRNREKNIKQTGTLKIK